MTCGSLGFLIDSNLVAWIRVLSPIYISVITKKNQLSLPIYFRSVHKTVTEHALVDSGATENFINELTLKRLGLGKRELDQVRMVFNINGMENKKGKIMHYTMMRVLHGGRSEVQKFFITSLGGDRLILGYPWLKEFNPKID